MRVVLVGLGSVGQGFLSILQSEEAELRDRYGLRVKVIAALDTSGAVVQPSGIPPDALLEAKRSSDGLAALQPLYRPGRRALEIIHTVDADVVVEATPTNILDAEPAMSHIRGALKTGRHVVTANKGPIALAMPYLRALAEERGVFLRFSGTVGGGTPMLDLARLGLRGDRITSIAGILNGTTNYVLTRMAEGLDMEEALGEAQKLGYAEADPTYDLKGIDSGIKLAILANWTMDAGLSVTDIDVRGIDGVTRTEVEKATAQGKVVKLLARYDGSHATVSPEVLPENDPLSVRGRMNAVTYTTEHLGPVTLVGPGSGGRETAAAMLRDLIDIHIRSR